MSVAQPSFGTSVRLSLRSLGGASISVSRPGRESEVAFEAGKPLALLAYLAISPSHAESRDHLIDLLWTNLEPEKARNAIRQTIWQIRRRIGENLFAETPDPVTLLAAIPSDRDHLLTAWEHKDLEAVVQLYAGDFLPSFAAPGGAEFERWADTERAHLRGIFVRAADWVARDRLANARYRDAQYLARRVRDLDRLNQAGWRLLLECLVAGQNSPGAGLEADALERVLREEDLEPEPATRAMLRVARTPARSSLSHNGDANGAPVAELTGREREFSAILQAWEEARSGRFCHLHIVAPAGLGKSRLLEDVHARLRAGLARVVLARAEFGARGIAYAFASDIAASLGARQGARGISPQAASALVALNPILSTAFNAAPDTATGEEALRRRALALRELLFTLTEDHPVALLLDDLHWSDPDSVRLLEFVTSGLSRARILVVTTARDTDDASPMAGHGTRIDLLPLPNDAIAAMLSSIAFLPNEPWAERLPAALSEATRGSPLLVLETLHLLLERSVLSIANHAWVAKDARLLFEFLGEGSALRRRLAGLDVTERQLLLFLSVAGSLVTEQCLIQAAARTPSDVLHSLGSLLRRGLAARRGDSWRAAHDEHASTMLELASADDTRTAAAALGRVLAAEDRAEAKQLRQAAGFLAQGGDVATLARVFARIVRVLRREGERRSDGALAREVLGGAATESLVSSLVRGLPLLVRARLVTRRRIANALAAGIAVPLLLAAAVAWQARRAVKPDVVLALERLSRDGTSLEVTEVPVDVSRWAGVGLMDVDAARRAKWYLPADGNGGRDLRPDGKGWTFGRIVPDSGVIDIVDSDGRGRQRRLTFATGDDFMPSWAPDNSRFVFATMRWNARARYDLAIYDTLTREVKQLTSGDDVDTRPAWSPDGSRIAFAREYFPQLDYGLCVIDADGENEYCSMRSAGRVLTVLRWSDSHHVVVSLATKGRDELWRIIPDSGTSEIIDPSARGASVSPDGRWVLCTCGRNGYAPETQLLYPIDRPGEFRQIRLHGFGQLPASADWAPSSPRLPYVATLRILATPGAPVVGSAYQLRVAGAGLSGDEVLPGVVRWRSLDTLAATVDSLGLLRPQKTGQVTVEASAGGWRRTSLDLTIREPITQVLLDERWRTLTPNWIPFGDPKPRLTPSLRMGPAFAPNGGKSFFSGAYTRQSFSTTVGVWLESSVSAPVTMAAPEWQDLHVSFFTIVDSAAWAKWDHVHGYPSPGASPNVFGVRYQVGANGDPANDLIGFGVCRGYVGRGPARMRSGTPVRLTLQIFPDGRCGIALDGHAAWVGPPAYFDRTARVMLSGNSVGTTILVGALRVSSGIAPIGWDHLKDAKTAGSGDGRTQ